MLTRGDDGTGWSLAWKVNLWACLGEAEHALNILNMQFHLCPPGNQTVMTGGGSYPNLLGAHPPFQIDSNFGIVAGIANMLLQNKKEELVLFPAKPDNWEEGSAKGLLAYGGITVDLTWNKNVKTATLTSKQSRDVCVSFNGTKTHYSLQENIPCQIQLN